MICDMLVRETIFEGELNPTI